MHLHRSWLVSLAVLLLTASPVRAEDEPQATDQEAGDQDAEVVPPTPPKPANLPKRILILSSQLLDPSKDPGGVNALVKKLAPPFAAELERELEADRKDARVVINEDDKLTDAQVLAREAARDGRDAVILVRVETAQIPAGTQLVLRATFHPLTVAKVSGGTSVTPGEATTQDFVLQSPDGKDERYRSLGDLAQRFVAILDGRNKI